MISIVPITARNFLVFKAVRLQALQDSPYAFCSTYARESEFTDEEWIRRAENWNGARGAGFLATDENGPCGIVGSFLDERDATQARLVSMWTAPTHRTLGVGTLLVRAAESWARDAGANTMTLMVTSNNQSAKSFYEKIGYASTGVQLPHSTDPAEFEHEMSRRIL
jgi:GNAT superfamily N-acetyltransferase